MKKYLLVEHRNWDELDFITIQEIKPSGIGEIVDTVTRETLEQDKAYRSRAEIYFGRFIHERRTGTKKVTTTIIKEDTA